MKTAKEIYQCIEELRNEHIDLIEMTRIAINTQIDQPSFQIIIKDLRAACIEHFIKEDLVLYPRLMQINNVKRVSLFHDELPSFFDDKEKITCYTTGYLKQDLQVFAKISIHTIEILNEIINNPKRYEQQQVTEKLGLVDRIIRDRIRFEERNIFLTQENTEKNAKLELS